MSGPCENLDLIQDMKKDLYGNGQPGLKEEVALVKQDVQWLKRIGGWTFGMVATILCGCVVAGVVALVKHF